MAMKPAATGVETRRIGDLNLFTIHTHDLFIKSE